MNICKQCNEKEASKMFCSKACRNKFNASKADNSEEDLTRLKNKFLLAPVRA